MVIILVLRFQILDCKGLVDIEIILMVMIKFFKKMN